MFASNWKPQQEQNMKINYVMWIINNTKSIFNLDIEPVSSWHRDILFKTNNQYPTLTLYQLVLDTVTFYSQQTTNIQPWHCTS